MHDSRPTVTFMKPPGALSQEGATDTPAADGARVGGEMQIGTQTLSGSLYAALCGLDQAILGLDRDLCIFFFVPAARQVFNIRPGDVGRPLADFRCAADDAALFDDARAVLASGLPCTKNLIAADGRWLARKIVPNLDENKEITGISLLYTDITEQKNLTVAFGSTMAMASQQRALTENRLTAFNHDLRQNMQNLVFLHDRLRIIVTSPEGQRLLHQSDAMLEAMSARLETLCQSEPGTEAGDDPVLSPPQVDSDAGTADLTAGSDAQSMARHQRHGTVLLVARDLEMRALLDESLREHGFNVVTAENSESAIEIASHGAIQPDAIVSDYNLSDDIDGLALGAAIRTRLRREIPLMVLTGNVSAAAVTLLEAANCIHLTKPIRIEDIVRHLAGAMHAAAADDGISPAPRRDATTICIIDGEEPARAMIREMLEEEGYRVEAFADAEAYLAAALDPFSLCLLLDLKMPGLSGTELLANMQAADALPPAIVLTALQEPQEAVRALKAGAVDFLIKPVARQALLAAIERVVAQKLAGANPGLLKRRARELIAQLTERQLQVMALILAGLPNKIIAADMGVSQRTVENHRAAIMHRTGARSLPELARLSVAAGLDPVT